MAKKTTKPSYGFSSMRKTMETISKKTSILIEDDKTPAGFIDTGVYMLNALFSKSIYGGVPNNRFSIFAGEEAVGKSYLCYSIARNAQKDGYCIIYIDTEYSIELHEMEEHGVDVSEDKLMLIRSNVVEDIKITLAQFLTDLKEQKIKGVDLDKIIIFIDSIGQLASRKELQDAIDGKDKADMTRAKAIKSLFRIITADLGFLNIPLICTNHIYLTTDLFPQAVQSGGTGMKYSPSVIVYLTKAKLKTGDEDELDLGSSGIVVTALARKNRKAKPKKIKFEISHGKGMNKFKGLDYFCTLQNFEKVGIAKVKPEVDKKTGEITYKEGGNKWYVRHLDKSFFEKQLYTSKIFNKEVLDALEPIIKEYFSYASIDEIDKIEKEMDELYEEYEKEFDIDEDDDDFILD